MFVGMTRTEIYRQYLQGLMEIYSTNECAVITDWVFEKVAGLKRAELIKDPHANLNPATAAYLDHCLAALLQHKPVQYVLGEAWFYKMKFKVNENVLIPRPETEELVQWVLDEIRSGDSVGQPHAGTKGSKVDQSLLKDQQLCVLDIGTGSGCIAISLKKNLRGIAMYAIDLNDAALSIAKENATKQQVDIYFSALDFLNESNWKTLDVFDVIISNPPYIPLNEKDRLDKNVSAFEPHTALFVPDDNPLLFYKKIAAFGKKHLQPGGKIYVEIHEDFAKATAAVFDEQYKVEIKKDMFGKERMLLAVQNSRAGP